MGSASSIGLKRKQEEAQGKIGDGLRERDARKISQGVKMAVKAGLPDVVFRKSDVGPSMDGVEQSSTTASVTISPFDKAVDEAFIKGVAIMLKVCMLSFVEFTPVIFSRTRTRSRTKIKAISSLELELELEKYFHN